MVPRVSEEAPPRPRRRPPSARQVEETMANRRAILLRAVEFFAANGYDKTTLQEIAESVGLTRTGLLHHFPSKESLFLQAIEACHGWAETQVRDSAELRGLAGVRALSGFLGRPQDAVWIRFVHILRAEALHSDAPEPLVDFVRQRSARIQSHLEARLREALEDGEVQALDVASLAMTVSATINGLQIQWLLDPGFDTGAAFAVLTEVITVVPEATARG